MMKVAFQRRLWDDDFHAAQRFREPLLPEVRRPVIDFSPTPIEPVVREPIIFRHDPDWLKLR